MWDDDQVLVWIQVRCEDMFRYAQGIMSGFSYYFEHMHGSIGCISIWIRYCQKHMWYVKRASFKQSFTLFRELFLGCEQLGHLGAKLQARQSSCLPSKYQCEMTKPQDFIVDVMEVLMFATITDSSWISHSEPLDARLQENLLDYTRFTGWWTRL